MANIKSQKQRVITNEKARQKNAATKSALKTYIKNAVTSVDAKEKDAKEKVSTAQSKLASAASKGRIHKRAAARKTSRLMKKASA
ncbi:MAG: 30S ribosomal protein S20 [Acidimicrobiia bacterium]